MNIKTRKINLLRDVSPLVEIIEEKQSKKEEMKLYIENTVKQGGAVLIAEEEDKRIGFIIVKLKGEAIKGDIRAYIDFIYILEIYQQKIAKDLLMMAAKQWCENRKIPLETKK